MHLILLEVIHQKAFDEGTKFINAFKILFQAKEIESKPGVNDMIQMTFDEFSLDEEITMNDFCMRFCYNLLLLNKQY